MILSKYRSPLNQLMYITKTGMLLGATPFDKGVATLRELNNLSKERLEELLTAIDTKNTLRLGPDWRQDYNNIVKAKFGSPYIS